MTKAGMSWKKLTETLIFFLPCLNFHWSWRFCTLLSPSGTRCYRNMEGWLNCLYWDADTFELFPCWRRASQKVFLVIWDHDDAVRRHSQSLHSLNLQGCSTFSEAVNSAWESANSMAASWSTYRHALNFFKDKPRRWRLFIKWLKV